MYFDNGLAVYSLAGQVIDAEGIYYITSDHLPSGLIDNRGYTPDEKINQSTWHVDPSAYLNLSGMISPVQPPLNLSIVGLVALNNATFNNIPEVTITAPCPEKSKALSLFVQNAGSQVLPIHALTLENCVSFLTGESWISQLNIKAFEITQAQDSALYVNGAAYNGNNITLLGNVTALTELMFSGHVNFRGMVSSQTVRVSSGSLYICGEILIDSLITSNLQQVEFCKESYGKIVSAAFNCEVFSYDGSVKIDHLNIKAKRTEFKSSVQTNSIAIHTDTFSYLEPIFALQGSINITLTESFIIGKDIFATETIDINAAGAVVNKAIMKATAGSFNCTEFINQAKVEVTNLGNFSLHGLMQLDPHSEMQLGALALHGNGMLCRGCRLIVRGTETSTVTVNSFVDTIEFYQKGALMECGKKEYEWVCDRYSTPWYEGGDGYANIYCKGSSYCEQETHSFGVKGSVVFGGQLNLATSSILIEMSNMFVKHLTLVKAATPNVISNYISKRVYVKDAIEAKKSTTTCKSVAKEYEIEGCICHSAAENQYVLTKTIGEVQASLFVYNVTGTVDQGIMLNWQRFQGDQPVPSTALVPTGYFNNVAHSFTPYQAPYDLQKIFQFNIQNMQFLNSLLSSQTDLETTNLATMFVSPLLASRSYIAECASDSDALQQLDCEQYAFLKALGFDYKGTLPVQFDFATWKTIIDKFIYQQSDFHLIRVIANYASSLGMFRDFATNALTDIQKN